MKIYQVNHSFMTVEATLSYLRANDAQFVDLGNGNFAAREMTDDMLIAYIESDCEAFIPAGNQKLLALCGIPTEDEKLTIKQHNLIGA